MTDKARELQDIGQSAYESIAEMVAALNVDYDRLEELREARDDDGACENATPEAWAAANPADAAELAELEKAAGECESREDAEQRIQEDPLSVEIRSGWYAVGATPEPEEYCILLSTGGPAVRIIGTLGAYNEPQDARLQVQDWFTPWADYNGANESVLLEYARQFYFGG